MTGRLLLVVLLSVLALSALVLAGCAPSVQSRGAIQGTATLTDGAVIAGDGARLPLRVWPAEGKARAIIIALHGFNDYSRSFAMPAHFWAARGVTTYAYDQRGFGQAPHHGLWPGVASLESDLRDVIAAVRRRHPTQPLFLVGESMGSSVILATLGGRPGVAGPPPPAVDGVVLGAPAVWGRSQMNPLYRVVLFISSYLVPWQKFTGRGLGVQASDNIAMLRAQGRDPLVIKETRVDAVAGMVDMMDAGAAGAAGLRVPALVLYGAHDQIIPAAAVRHMMSEMRGPHRLVYYRRGWHMLFRDRQGETVWRDVLAWIENRQAPLPSGEERKALPEDGEAVSANAAGGEVALQR